MGAKESWSRLTREVFQHAEADRLAIWWGGTLWVEKLSAQNSAAEPQYPPRYGPRKFLTILHEWLLGAAVAWSAGRVSKRVGFKSEGRGFESSLKNFFAFFFLPDLEVFSRVFEVGRVEK